MAVAVAWLLSPAGARAATVVVPTEYATIQAAVNAVQGTTAATVRIDSDATFLETVTVSETLLIEAGDGFSPTIQGAAATSCGGFLGACTVLFRPTSDVVAMSFGLRGVRLVPRAGASSGDRVLLSQNDGDADAIVILEEVVVDDPDDSGAQGVQIRQGGGAAGRTNVAVIGGQMTLGGVPQFNTTAFEMPEGGALGILGLTLVMSNASAMAFNVGGTADDIVFSLAESDVTLNAPGGFFASSLGQIVRNTDATVRDNVFRLNSGADAFASGFRMGTGPFGPFSSSLRFESNVVVGSGPNSGAVLSIFPFGQETVSLVAVDNVVRGMQQGFVFNPQGDPDPGDPGGVLHATLTNNTIHGSSDSAIRLTMPDGTTTTLDLFNNLLTHSGGCALEADIAEGVMVIALASDHQGLFANAGGDFCGFGGAGANDVVADPLYVDAAGGDLRLAFGSPMIDQGRNDAPELPALDAAGVSRILDGTVDIGAFEFVTPPTTTTTSSSTSTSSSTTSSSSTSSSATSSTSTSSTTATSSTAATSTTTTTSSSSTTTTAPALLAGQTLMLADHPTKPEKRRLLVTTKGSEIDLGAGPGSPDDPVEHGGRLRVWVGDEPAGDHLLSGWTYRKAKRPEKGYRLRGDGPIARVVLAAGAGLRIVGKGEELAHRLGEAAPGVVVVELTLGARRYCLAFGGTEQFKPERRLRRKRAERPSGCGPAM